MTEQVVSGHRYRRGAIVFVLVAAAALARDADAAKTSALKNSLLSVVTPTRKEPAHAHPFVNVIVTFGQLSNGTPADPASFSARIGREDLTHRFEPMLDAHGRQIGARAKLEPPLVKLGRRPRNHLRLSIVAARLPGPKGPRVRDVDDVRFGAVDAPDEPCTAQAGEDQQVIVPGIQVNFTGSKGTTDPDRDELTYLWDFGDGTTSTEPDPSHTYAEPSGDVHVTLTASDGQLQCQASILLEALPPLCSGCTAGTLRVDATTSLEFNSVPPGTTATRTITLKNTDATATSSIPLRLESANASFQVSETSVTLGPDESHDVTITFAPQAAGHQSAHLSLVANAANRRALSFLAHGYGGTGPGAGPTMAADSLFFTDGVPSLLGFGMYAYTPDGQRVYVDSSVNTCVVAGNGSGTGDYCVTNQDCAANGGTCETTSTCPSGANMGKPCSVPADCPGSFCPSFTLFDPVDFCSDGQSLFMLSDDGTYTDPNPNDQTEVSKTIMRVDYQADGTVTKKDILSRATSDTEHIGCDGFPASEGGQVYIPEAYNLPDSSSCFRSEREALVRISKSNGASQVLVPRIDAYEGLDPCSDDLDPVDEIALLPDGSVTFVTFDSGGLWRIRPTPIFFSPDIVDTFQVHADGSVMWASTTDSGSTGLVSLYRISATDVEHGPLPFAALTPCASVAVPNNGGRSVVFGFAADVTAPGSMDMTGLVSFFTSVPSLSTVEGSALAIQGTVAFDAPPGTNTCSVTGLVNLQALQFAP